VLKGFNYRFLQLSSNSCVSLLPYVQSILGLAGDATAHAIGKYSTKNSMGISWELSLRCVCIIYIYIYMYDIYIYIYMYYILYIYIYIYIYFIIYIYYIIYIYLIIRIQWKMSIPHLGDPKWVNLDQRILTIHDWESNHLGLGLVESV